MALPAGYSSEEDEFGDFADEVETESWNCTSQSIVNTENNEEFKQNSLYMAVINGYVTEIQKELENDLDSNIILRDNWSLLLLAASVGNPEITNLLIESGADVNYDRDKFTVLMAACNCPSSCASPENVFTVVKQLINKGADVKAVNRRRMTPLMYACSSGNLEVVKLLLPLSNKFATDNQGWNALFWAVNDNRVDIVKLLIEEGFRETQLDIRNNTVLSYAVENDFIKIIELFPSQQNNVERIYNSDFKDFESIFQNLKNSQRPEYLNELYNILCGCKSEQALSYFLAHNIDLNTFLSMTDEQLKAIGILLPFQRYKILNGLYRFHKHPFFPTSIPNVQKDELYSNIETAKSVATAVRQLVCMEATINYLIAYSHMLRNSIEEKTFLKSINNISDKLIKLKSASNALNQKAQFWDYLNSPADLIQTDSRGRKKYSFKIKCVGILLLPVIFVVCKTFLLRK